MATVKAVRNAEADPKQGKPKPKSGVRFPYNDLAQSIETAKVIHEKAGGLCDRAQLAALLGYSGVNNGSFLTRVSAAKMFGLIEDTDDQKLRVSARGRAIVAPVSDAQATRAKVDAFLAVELFKKVFDQFNGTSLPEQVGLRNLLATEYQVVPDRIVPTVRIMLDSAEQAGLFKATGSRTRMVMPLGGNAGVASPAETPAQPPAPARREGNGGGSGSGDGGDGIGGNIDPAILGLLHRLPAGGTPLTSKRRKSLIDAFTAIVGFVYPDADGEGE